MQLQNINPGTIFPSLGDVTAAANLGDNLLIRGDGAGKGIQNSGISIDDSDNMSNIASIALDTGAGVSVSQGQIAWNADEETIDIGLNGAILQAGQETHYHVRNNTGVQIDNGTAVMATGTIGASGRITIGKMDGSSIANAKFFLGITTEDIADSTDGKVTAFGKVRGIDTSSWNEGDVLWVDNATAGALTSTEPTTGTRLPVAFVVTKSATVGVIAVRATDGTYLAEAHDTSITGEAVNDVIVHDGTNWINDGGGVRDFFNGTFQESFDALVTSDGATITMSLEQSGTGDLTMRYSDGNTVLDCTPAQTIALTAGSDASPQANYIYIPQSTKVLTKSTTAFPSTAEHIKIGYFLVPSATFVQSDGCYVNQNWNDHSSNGDGQGHMAHMAQRIRRSGAQYFSGIDANGTTSYLTIVGTTVDFKSTSGIISQMHDHTSPAFDTSAGDKVLVHNWFGDNYHAITNLYDIVADSTGAAIANNQYFNLIIGGVANKSGEYEPVMMNLPSGTYTTQLGAERDLDGFDDFTLPRQFGIDSSTGFYICRITVQKKATTWEWKSTVDLRGTTPQSARGATSASVTQYPDNQFAVFDETDITKVMDFDVGTNVPTGTIKTIIMAATDVDLSDIAVNTAKTTNATHTGEVTGSGALTIDKTAITNKTLVTGIAGDFVLVTDGSDSDNLKRVNVSDFLAGGGASQLSDLSDVVSATNTNRFALMANGTTGYVGRALVEADISDLGTYIENVVEDLSPQLGGSLDTNSKAINQSKGADVASATALNLGADGNYFDITGTTAITSINTEGIGTQVTLHFDGILTLTHHATDLILPSGANITTAAGDEATFIEYATGDWRCVSYSRADGTALVSAGGAATKEFFVPIAATLASFPINYEIITNTYYGKIAANGDAFSIAFYVPNDFTSITDMVMLVYPDATETVQWDFEFSAGALGEAISTHTGTDANRTQAVTTTVIQELDLNQGNVATATSSLSAGDFVVARFISNTSNIRALGIRFKYA